MPIGRRSLVLAAVLAAGQVVAQEPAGRPPGIAWLPDYDAALERAGAEKRPVMIAFAMKGEPANEDVARGHFKDRRIIEMSRRFVCLLACAGSFPKVEGVRHDGTKGEVCSRYGSVTSDEYNQVEMRARTDLLQSPVVSTPQFIFLMPDGQTVLLRHVWLLPVTELLDKMRLAYALFDPQSAPELVAKHTDRVDRLVEQATDRNTARRRGALQTLAMVDDPRIPRFLMEQTGRDVDQTRRLEAIFFMGERGNAKVLPCLHDLVQARDSLTRVFSAVSLERIGMRESVEVLSKVLNKARKDRVKANVLRALAACGGDVPPVRKAVMAMLKARSQLERCVALWVATGLEPDDDLKRAVMRAAQSRNTQVRCAAYHAIGALHVAEARKGLERKQSSEKGRAGECLAWALAELGGELFDGELDVPGLVEDMLPDGDLRSGDLSGL